MEKHQISLCQNVLKRLQASGCLQNVMVVGSWCLYFYEAYFNQKDEAFTADIRTRDIDFLVPLPIKATQQVNVPELLKDLGFILTFHGEKGYLKLEHPDLIVEFLVAEKGRGRETPFLLPNLGMNAQSLRFLDFLSDHKIKVDFMGIVLNLPHPAAFAFHKMLISSRRGQKTKADKDRRQALNLLKYLLSQTSAKELRTIFSSLHPRWRITVAKEIRAAQLTEVLAVLGLN